MSDLFDPTPPAAPAWASAVTSDWARLHPDRPRPDSAAEAATEVALASTPHTPGRSSQPRTPGTPAVFRGAARVHWSPPSVDSGGWLDDGEDIAEPAGALMRADTLTADDLRAGDTEAQLAAGGWRLDPRTLREVVTRPAELTAVAVALTHQLHEATDDATRARLLSLRAVAGRLLGQLGPALNDGKDALVHAKATGELRQIAVVRARLAHVHHWRGEYAAADRLFALADSPELPATLRATVYEQAGRSSYEQGRLVEACQHFDRAVTLCPDTRSPLLNRIDMSLAAVAERAGRSGFGPPPRPRAELLGAICPPAPARDDRTGSWGYADATGRQIIAASYAQAQPFGDGVAWVQDQQTSGWQLIDATGRALTTAAYDDVRPFRRGLAAVRQQGWGAIDQAGNVVVPLRYNGFATALADGRYLDGFTDEGLAVIEAAGWRGVLDRTGRQLVAPQYRAVVIHPLAFLIADVGGRWGALDRLGRPLIAPRRCDRRAVTSSVARLLQVSAPVL